MAWKSYVYVLDCDGYPNNYTTNELNSIVQTAQQDIKFDYPAIEQAWKDDGNIEERYTLDSTDHDKLPDYVLPYGKIKHDNVLYYDFEDQVHERAIITHWDEDVEQFTVMVVISDTVSLVNDKTVLE